MSLKKPAVSKTSLSTASLPFQGRVFLLLPLCKQNASLQQVLSHMAMVTMMIIMIGMGEEAVADSRRNNGQMSMSIASERGGGEGEEEERKKQERTLRDERLTTPT